MVERSFADGTRIVIVNHPSGTSDVLLQLHGRQVSRVVIVPMLMRIGAAVVRMDGIGGVGTEEEFRNRGYSRRVMETAVQQMRAGRCGALDPVRYRGLLPEVRLRDDRSGVHRRLAPRGRRDANPIPASWVAVPAPDRRRHAGGDAALSRQYQTGDRRAGPPRRGGRPVGDGAASRRQPRRAKDRTAGLEPAARQLRSTRGRTPAACSSTSGAGSRPTPGSAPTGGWASAGVTSLAPSISPRGWPGMPRRPMPCWRRAGPGPTKREAIAIRWRWRFPRKVRSPGLRHTRVGR